MLSILQAPGCNFTVVDGGQLAGLSSIKALHLQGYAHKKEKQISGFEPNSIQELIAHKKVVEQEVKRSRREHIKELRLALAEDALQPLTELQLLDLQFVRLVASKEARRSRRYSKEPIAATTLLDMPLKQFLEFANKVDSFYLPPHLQLPVDFEQNSHEILENDDSLKDNQINLSGDSYKLQIKTFERKDNKDSEPSALDYGIKLDVAKNRNLKEAGVNENIVPYSIYRVRVQPKLAPFKNQKKLKYLRVAHARLDRIGAELLDGLQQLHTLTLEYNRIKILPNGLFGPTPNLRHLSLAHNNVLLLERDSLEGLSKLLTIDLDHNEMSVLGPGTFPALPSLKTLRISQNPIAHLLPGTFAALNSTESIFLGSYNISMDVHENSFRFLYYLKNLVLNNVTTKGLQTALLMGMPSVQHLTIHGNLEEIDYDAFSATPYLQSLNLSYCHLNYLSLDAFYGLTHLITLDLSHNQLLAISPGTFDHLTSLRELYLHNNLLTTLPLGIFIPISPRLIQLHNNPWICTCDLLQLKPSLTNKIKRTGHVICQWDDKLATICKKNKDRLVYDARVAPLCQEPAELAGNDVFHAALRHLKCSKYHWDPRLLHTENKDSQPVKLPQEEQNIELLEETEEDLNKEEQKEKRPNWLPLTAFTPEPIDTEDLLEIAEKEGLEEVLETSLSRNTQVTPLILASPNPKEFPTEHKMKEKNIPQNDQPSSNKSHLLILKERPLTSQVNIYKQQKAKLKTMQRKHWKMQKMNKSYLKKKSQLKAMISARQKDIFAPSRRFQGNHLPNNLISNDLKNNIDIY